MERIALYTSYNKNAQCVVFLQMLVLYTQDFQGIYLQKKLEKLLIKSIEQ